MGRGGEGSNCLGGLDPIHFWHLDVHQNEIVGGLVYRFDRLFTVVHGINGIPQLFEREAGHLQIDLIVIDAEDSKAVGMTLLYGRGGALEMVSWGESPLERRRFRKSAIVVRLSGLMNVS